MIRSQAQTFPPVLKGTLFVLAASIGFGLNPLFARWAYISGLTPESAMLYRAIVPALFTIPGLMGVHKQRKASVIALLLGMFIAVGTLTYFRSIAVVPVATAALVYFTYPLFTIVLGWLFFRHRLTGQNIVTSILILLACALILSPAGLAPSQLSALAISFLMPISFATILLGLEQWLTALKPQQVLALSLWGQAFILVSIISLQRTPQLLPNLPIGWLAILGLVSISSFMPQLFTIRGTLLLGAEKTAVFGTFELITSLIVGWTILAEPIRLPEIIGAALLLTAILLKQRKQEGTSYVEKQIQKENHT